MSNAFVSSSSFFAASSSVSSFSGNNTTGLRHNAPRTQPCKSIQYPRMSANVLIVNTKGGGHGHIGLHLAENLLSAGNKVHIHQVGNETSSEPIKQYPTLKQKYSDNFTVEYGAIPSKFENSYSVIYDNNAKSEDDINPAISNAKQSGAKLFYVSSAGAYKYDANVAPHEITNPASGATIDVENLIINANVCSANFRPIYIIGPHTSKREYVDFFFDRLVRNRPVPLPGTGDELTSISDVRDIAALLASAVDKDLKNNLINCVNTRAITFNGMVELCAKASGVEPKIVYYDPKKMESLIDGFKVKKAFPFRPRHFFADPAQAQTMLGWKPTYAGTIEGLGESVKTCYEEYVKLGLDKADVDFSLDDKILANL